MVWIGFLCCKKFWRDFIARTFALIAPVRPDLHRVSHSNEMFPNAPKHYEMHQNMSLGFNGMDRVPSLRKIPTRLRYTNFCINCTCSTQFGLSCSNEMVPNAPKHYEMHQDMSSGSKIQWLDWVPSLRKIPTRLCCTNFSINCTRSARFAPSFTQ